MKGPKAGRRLRFETFGSDTVYMGRYIDRYYIDFIPKLN